MKQNQLYWYLIQYVATSSSVNQPDPLKENEITIKLSHLSNWNTDPRIALIDQLMIWFGFE